MSVIPATERSEGAGNLPLPIDPQCLMIHRDPVRRFGARDAHLAVKEIALDGRRIALDRVAVSSGSRQTQAHEVTGLQSVARPFDFNLRSSGVPGFNKNSPV